MIESKEHTLTRTLKYQLIELRAGFGSGTNHIFQTILEWFQAHGEEAKERHLRLEMAMLKLELFDSGLLALETEIKKCIQYSPASQRMTDA